MAQRFNPTELSLSGDASPVAEKVAGSVLWAAFSVSENGTLVYAPAGRCERCSIGLVGSHRQAGGPVRPARSLRRLPAGAGRKAHRVRQFVERQRRCLGAGFGPGRPFPAHLRSGDRRSSHVVPRRSSGRVGLKPVPGRSTCTSNPRMARARSSCWSRWVLRLVGRKTGRGTGASSSTRFRVRKPDRIYGSRRSRPKVRSGDRKPFPYLQTEFDEKHGRFSPDGHWVAYTSNESGRDEVYVQSFPVSGAKFQISAGGGMEPQWRKDGTELFYIADDRTLMAVPVKLASSASEPLQVGQPKRLLSVPMLDTFIVGRSYEVSNDGQRFLMRALASGATRAAADGGAQLADAVEEMSTPRWPRGFVSA